ncbi:MAG: PPC domain-containing protein, partial [Myxococcota bacterium]|nr:PPC domain-containing protein [Myxococcota bacterium]
INPEDVGLGKVKVSVLNGPGFLVSEGTNEDENGNLTNFVRLEDVVVTDIDMGTYKVVVEQDGAINSAGLRYSIQIDLADPDILNACKAPRTLTENAVVTGNFNMAQSTGLTTTCADTGGTLRELLYRFEIKERAYASFLGQGAANFSISVREACSIDSTELPGACAAEAGAGDIERLGVALDPGVYFAVLQAEDINGGDYILSYSTQAITCDPVAAKTCVNGNTAQECNDTLTGVRQITCAFGCDANLGACATKVGDVCENPIIVDPAIGYAADIERDTYNNSYDPGANSCVPDNSSSQDTDGPDTVFQITVPDGKVLSMTIEGIGGDDTTIYLTEDCADVANSCIVGVNQYASTSDDETLFWRNDTGMDKTIFAIMDVEDESTLSDPFVEIEVQDFICAPGSAICGTNNRESLICNDTGTGYTVSIECTALDCNPTTGRCSSFARDTCGEAEVLTSGVSISGDLTIHSDRYTDNCGSGEGTSGSSDAVFLVENVPANARIVVETLTGFDAFLSINRGCDASTNSFSAACLEYIDQDETNPTVGDPNTYQTEVLTFEAPSAGDYYIILDGGDVNTTEGSYQLTATVQLPSCTPGDIIGCNAAGDAVLFCERGFEAEFPCSSGVCDPLIPSCTNPSGEVCAEARELVGPTGQVTGTFDATINSLELPAKTLVGSCIIDDFDQTDGDEYFYVIDLQPGDLLTASFQSTYISSRFYLQQSCGSRNSCFGLLEGSGSNQIQYRAENAERVYLVIDSVSTSTSTSTWTLDWNITQGAACTPNANTCVDAFTQRTCDAAGIQFTETTCPNGCQGGYCVDAPAQDDICSANVPDLGTGATILFNPGTHTNSADPESCADGDGPDAFYQITAQAGDLIQVTGTGRAVDETPSAYIFSDCADVAGTCVAGATGDATSDAFDLIYQVPTTGTYFVGLDSTLISYDELQTFTIRTLPPQCNDQTPLSCDPSGQALRVCRSGIFDFLQCDGGCSSGACINPQGNYCEDAIQLDAQTSPLTGNWAGATNELFPPGRILGACLFDDFDGGDGVDRLYSIHLDEGDVLDVTVASEETNVILYVLDDCNGAFEPETCVSNDPREGNTTDRELSFAAPATGTYYIVLDRTDTTDNNDFTLSWSVDTAASCAPNKYACLDANTLGLCNSDGSALATSYACPNGCLHGTCVPDFNTWDTCSTAPTIGEGLFTVADMSLFNNSFTATSNSCTGTDGDGNDFFLRVDLQPNEIVFASVMSVSFDVPTISIIEDCADPEQSCLVGVENPSSTQFTRSEIFHKAGNAPETVYVHVDSDAITYDEPFIVEIEKKLAECDESTFVNRCAGDNQAYEYCDDIGFIQRYECNDTNADGVACTMGRCDEPVGDLCEDPFEVLPDASGNFTMMGVLAGATSDTSLQTGNACTGSLTRGPDPVYGLNVLAGQTVTVNLVSTEATPEDLAVYITTDCDTLPNSCVAGSDAQGNNTTPETATFTAQQDRRVYIVVDSYYELASGAYQLDVNVQ